VFSKVVEGHPVKKVCYLSVKLKSIKTVNDATHISLDSGKRIRIRKISIKAGPVVSAQPSYCFYTLHRSDPLPFCHGSLLKAIDIQLDIITIQLDINIIQLDVIANQLDSRDIITGFNIFSTRLYRGITLNSRAFSAGMLQHH
jgi:hypothetical protein